MELRLSGVLERRWEEEWVCPFCSGSETSWLIAVQERLCTACGALESFGCEELERVEESPAPVRLSA